jgi:dephospho-CoA kinase
MIIGLTGGIASGKSTVSRMLYDLGAEIIDADKVAREVVEPNQPTWAKIKERFGKDVFYEDGQLNRQKLGAIIFNDGQARLDLNAIIHPAIRQRMNEQKEEALKKGIELIVMDIPLLFESELEHMVQKVLVVYVPEAIQKMRLMHRDQIDEATALQKMKSQIPIEQKKEKGHAFIDNSGTHEETKNQLEQIIQRWRTEDQDETKC